MTLETPDSNVAHVLEVIATQLGVAAEQIFGVFVGAQPVIGVIDLVSILVVVGGAYFMAALCYKSLHDDKDADALGTSIVVFVVVAFVLMLIVNSIGDAVLKIACPEYSATKEIIALVKP